MGTIIRFPRRRHARALSCGYRSGRNSCRETPETRSTSSTRRGGTSSHCETACAVTPIRRANFACPPTFSTARFNAAVLSLMGGRSSIALVLSQAKLHCKAKAALYDAEMTLGKRIKAARERLRPKVTQAMVGVHFGVTAQAVSGWERDDSIPELDKIADLAELLKVPCAWLLKGTGAPPAPDALEAKIDGLRPSERAIIDATIDAIRRGRVA